MATHDARAQPTQPSRKPRVECVYCGKEIAKRLGRTRDHCVGRQFFPEPRPSDLGKVIVPCCSPCNEGPRKDEDYVRALLSLSRDAETPVGQRVHVQASRSLAKDAGLRRAIRRGLATTELRSEAGLYLGRATTQAVEWPRVRRVVGKWVRGLYWKEYGDRLDRSVTIEVAMCPVDVDEARDIKSAARATAGSWPGTFEYWHSRDRNEPLRSRWGFLLWDSRMFVAVTNQPLDVLQVGATY